MRRSIVNKIKKLIKDEGNFTSNNYGSEAADNGFYEVTYDSYAAKKTLMEFAEWLLQEVKQ